MALDDDEDTELQDDPPARRSSVDTWEPKFREERRRHRQANERISQLESELTQLRPKAQNAEQLNKRITDLEAKHAADRSGWDLEKAAMGAGITDAEGLLVARTLHSNLPEKDRPAIGSWLSELRKDPTKAPRSLQPYLATEDSADDDQEETPAAKPQPKKRPNPNGKVSPESGNGGKGGGGAPTRTEWDAARQKMRAGDRSDFDALTKRAGIKPLFGSKRGGGEDEDA